MPLVRTLVRVEDIDVGREQENPDTWLTIISYDGSGQYSKDGTKRLIVWRDSDDDDEYPRQHAEWYPLGTLIPLDVRV